MTSPGKISFLSHCFPFPFISPPLHLRWERRHKRHIPLRRDPAGAAELQDKMVDPLQRRSYCGGVVINQGGGGLASCLCRGLLNNERCNYFRRLDCIVVGR